VLLGMSSQNHDDGALDLGRAQLLFVFSRPICLFFKTFFFNKGVAPYLIILECIF
jgi:hypothetical protein